MKKTLLLNFLCIFLIGFNSNAQTEVEPNDNCIQANSISLNGEMTGTITGAGDDFYEVNIPEAGVLEVKVFVTTGSVNINAELFDADCVSTGAKAAGNAQSPVFLEGRICAAGKYYLKIGKNSGFPSNDNQYKITEIKLNKLDQYECNESFFEAASIDFNQPIKAQINGTPQDFDYYEFEVTTPGILQYKLRNVPGDLFLRTSVYNEDQAQLADLRVGLGQVYQIEVSICDIGTHYLKIEDQNRNTNKDEQYEFELEFIPFSDFDPLECDNSSLSTAKEIFFGNENTVAFVPQFGMGQDDADYYKYNITEPGIVTVEVIDFPTGFNLVGFIFDKTQNELIRPFQSRLLGNKTIYSVCETGFNYLEMTETNDKFSSSENFKLKVSFQPFSQIDRIECFDNSFNNAWETQCDVSYNLRMNPFYQGGNLFGDREVFKLELAQGENVKITVKDVPSDIGLISQIFDSNEQPINSTIRKSIQEGVGYTLDFTATESDQYFFVTRSSFGKFFNLDETYKIEFDCGGISSVENDNFSEQTVSISPNPFDVGFQIDFQDGIKNLEINLFDAFGKLVFKTTEMNYSKSSILINPEIPSGVYFLEISDSEERFTRKIIKQ